MQQAIGVRRADHAPRGDHGPVRPAEARVARSSASGARGTRSSRARNPGFLYQQNTLRDALVASVVARRLQQARGPREDGEHRADGERAAGDDPHAGHSRCCSRRRITCSSSTRVHHDAVLLPIALDARTLRRTASGLDARGQRHGVARHAAGAMHVTLTNLDPEPGRAPSTSRVRGAAVTAVTGRVLTADRDERAQHLRAARRGAAGAVHRRARRRRDGSRCSCRRSLSWCWSCDNGADVRT